MALGYFRMMYVEFTEDEKLETLINYLVNLINDNRTWTSKSLKIIENQNVIMMKAKYSSKGIRHKSEILLNKFI